MRTASGVLEWFVDEHGTRVANIRLGNARGKLRMLPGGKMKWVEAIFPVVVSSTAGDNDLVEAAQLWIDQLGGEPLVPDPQLHLVGDTGDHRQGAPTVGGRGG